MRDLGSGRQKMKNIFAAVMITMITWIVPAVAQPTDDEAKIRALENQFVAAVNTKDLDAIMKVYVPGQTLLFFDVVPPRLYVGAKAYRADWEDLLALFEITDLQITLATRSATVTPSYVSAVPTLKAGRSI
jgi:ketosteroid isomerase-like protein